MRVLPALAAAIPLALPAAAQGPSIEHGRAVLQGLDKISARVSPIEAALGERVRFGSLEIVVRACLETSPTEPPESAAFLEVIDLGFDDRREELFTGWMFASTPGLSALEHAVYDVWVVDCADPL